MSDRERGSVTAEFALVLPAVVLVVGLVFAALGWAGHRLAAQDLAALAARTAAVEGTGAAEAAVAQARADASVTFSHTAPWVRATVTLDGAPWLPAATAVVTARTEQ
ncbi:hypothetical protein ON058_00225 [Demequina sp. B12]|uniref:hypothetical protein n=1 Tax=Demequina sp. B12 TaxID=2992757 RepID=UPI00237C4AA1|nr:hypothetical protein [Demequina sp. B12]MDE0571840.1 hypothetical protein [Demequina sp. B12]